MKKHSKVLDILFTVAFPVAVWLIMEVLCLVFKQKHVISTMLDVKTIIRNAGIARVVGPQNIEE